VEGGGVSEPLNVVFISPEQAKQAIAGQIAPYCRQQWASGVERLAVTVQPEEDARTIRQLNFLWGVVYKETSEQARIDGQQYTPDAWHELGKRLHLPRKKTRTKVAGRKRPVITTSIGTLVGIRMRPMSLYITAFMAWATTDYGVQFSEPLPADLRPAPGKAKSKPREVIDDDTGEITQEEATA
jgi:hypothetical protein